MMALMPLFGLFQGTWGIEEILIAIVIIAGAVGVTLVALRVFKVTIPEWLVKIVVICVVVVVAIMAIRFIFSL